jgi:hypothetical protein
MMTGFVAELSFCVPCAATNYISYRLLLHTDLDYSQNRDRRSQDILILKGTKTDCLHMIIYQWYIFSNAILTFQFSFWSITEWQFGK